MALAIIVHLPRIAFFPTLFGNRLFSAPHLSWRIGGSNRPAVTSKKSEQAVSRVCRPFVFHNEKVERAG